MVKVELTKEEAKLAVKGLRDAAKQDKKQAQSLREVARKLAWQVCTGSPAPEMDVNDTLQNV